MTRPLPLLGQAAAYILFAAFLGFFSVAPGTTYLETGLAVIKLSFSHAGDRIGSCRRLSREEIANLPANMRRTEDCPRARLPVLIELEIDGKLAIHRLLPPVGLHRDGASAIYQRFPVAAGKHRIVARLRDSARTEGFDYEREVEIELAPDQNFVVDFRAESGGFIIK
jgi:hypothetical protein